MEKKICPSCKLEYGKPTFCSNKFHRAKPEPIDQDQNLSFQLAEHLDNAMNITYDGKFVGAYELESQIRHMLLQMNCVIIKQKY